ncbi:MAG: hypothetical protein J3K34DRAFT_408443 [Monoraphidium minutum]|nr:MAG: hypothetical protein J3K34DRAFT_408443 [Monoraphidium minutum]
MDIKVEGCDACLGGCTLGATAGAPPTCEAFAGHCPPSWPNPEGVEGAGWSLTMKFTPKAGQALCSDVNFGGHPSKVAANADYLLNEMFRASGKQAVNRYGEKPPASKQAAGTAAVCKEPAQIGRSYGIVQVFMDSTPYKNGTVEKFKKDLQNKWMMRNACPRDEDIPANMDPDIRAVLTDFCEKVGSPTDPITWAGVCVQDANPNKKYKVDGPIEKACFPGDALVTLLDPTNGAPLRKARMDELRIGDAVACLKPAARAGPGLARDDAQRYVPGACRVFNYHDVDAAATLPYVALHYTDASGAPSKLRATKEHLVYLAPSSLTTSDAPDGLPPGGSARRADMVVVGDLLAVAAGGGAFYTARVEKVTTERHTGAFAPLLTDAGLPIVDGAVAFAWAHLPEHDPHPAQNLGEFYRHIRLVRDFNDSLASGCAGAACPCLDAPDDAGRRCARLGDRLADMPAGLSDFAERTVGVWERAAAQGRNYWDYERGVALGRFWEGSQITQWAATRLLRLKPHTFAMAATDFLMVRPPAGAAGAYADATRAAAAAARAESAVAGLPAAS